MNTSLPHVLFKTCIGLLLITGGNALADNKKDAPITIEAKLTDSVKFGAEDHLHIFISPLPLHKKPLQDWGTFTEKDKQNAQVYCRKYDLIGFGLTEKLILKTTDLQSNDAFTLCDTSRYFSNEGSKVSLYYVDLPNQTVLTASELGQEQSRSEIVNAKKRASAAKHAAEIAQAKEIAITKIDSATNEKRVTERILNAKKLTQTAKSEAQRLEGEAELLELSQESSQPAVKNESQSPKDEEKKACSNTLQLPDIENIQETKRSTLLSIQTKQLANAILIPGTNLVSLQMRDIPLAEKSFTSEKLCIWEWKNHSLNERRAQVQIETVDPQKTNSPINLNIITGSPEHVFLTVDGLFKGAERLKAAAKNKDDKENKPEKVYLGFNYMLGDVYGKLSKVSFRRLVLKAMVTPNREFDSYGVGLGYRFSDSNFQTSNVDSEDHSGLVVFVGRFWTRPAKSPLDVPTTDARRVASTSFGISYSLGTALEWLKTK